MGYNTSHADCRTFTRRAIGVLVLSMFPAVALFCFVFPSDPPSSPVREAWDSWLRVFWYA